MTRRRAASRAPGLRLERELLRPGTELVAGVDEVGRGSVAGTVSYVAGTEIHEARPTGQKTATARPTTSDSGMNPWPGGCNRESRETDRWSPITHRSPGGTVTSNRHFPVASGQSIGRLPGYR